jgi:hypothetical protein
MSLNILNFVISGLTIWMSIPCIIATFEKHISLSQTDLTRTGIISNSYNEMFEA